MKFRLDMSMNVSKSRQNYLDGGVLVALMSEVVLLDL